MSKLERVRPPSWPMVLLALCSWNALLAVLLGKEMNWDLLNYHFYNGYAFLTGRLDRDLAPAQVQTFLNPLMDVPLYLAIVSLPPVVVGAAYGFVQGLNGVAVWLIGRELLPIEEGRGREWAAFGLAFLGELGATNVSQVGGSMGDTLVGIPVLFSVALLLRKAGRLETASPAIVISWAALAGAINGIGAGLKITSALYGVGFAFGCLFLVRALDRRLLVTVAFGAGAVGTWLLLSGFWLWQMWSRFGDPLFPFFRLLNSRSEFVGIVAKQDTRFLPKSAIGAVLYPLMWVINPLAVAEFPFRDWRLPILYLFIAVLAIGWCVRRWRQARLPRRLPAGALAFLLAGGLASYALWLRTFGTYRYLAPLEWLAPLGITLALWALLPRRYRTVAIVAVLVLTTATIKPINWGRAGWTKSYFGVVAPQIEPGASRMVLIAGLNGLSFVVPHFPADARFVRLQSNSYLYGMALGGFYGQGWSPNQFDKLVKRAIASHQGSLYVMFDGPNASPADRTDDFANSPEFRTKYGSLTNEEFVTLVYGSVLGRAPDPAGFAYWLGRLNSGAMTRGQVMLALFESMEYGLVGVHYLDAVLGKLSLRRRAESCQQVRILDTPRPPWAVFRHGYVQPPTMPAVTLCSVIRGPAGKAFDSAEFPGDAAPIAQLYFAYFNRAPDQAGLQYWVAQHKAGMSLAAISDAFTNSPEFHATYRSLTNEQFVALMYRNVLQRDPDPAGSAYWVGQLTSGALTRSQVMWKFLESPEH